jgi:hypothetical protein
MAVSASQGQNSANFVPSPEPSTAVSAAEASPASNSGHSFSRDGSASDSPSHRDQAGGPAPTPTEAARLTEANSLTFAADGASPAPPSQQIVAGIQRAVPAPQTGQTLTDAQQSTLDGRQPLKTITLSLSPANLGTVDVELSLKSGQLGVRLHVQEAGTAQLLRQDSGLEKLLESAGYAVKSLSIHLSPQASEIAPSPGQTAANGQSFSNPFGSARGGQEQAQPQSHKGQQTDRNADQRPGYGRTEDVSDGGSLYV